MATAACPLFLIALCVYTAGAVGVVGRSSNINDVKYFRDDYNFYPDARGWLKLHSIPSTWDNARFTCEHEGGAVLASPIHEGLRSAMTAELQSLQEPVFTGIRALSTYDYYYSIEGISLENMPIKWDIGEPNNVDGEEHCISLSQSGMAADVKCGRRQPFLCYKENIGIPNINECGTTDEGYRKDEITGSCYKFHRECMAWWRAHAVCAAEGGSLAIINSDSEANVIQGLLADNSPKVVSCHNDKFAFIGIYNWMKDPLPVYWSTIDGKTLEKAGFARWAKNEPNNLGGQEYCGTVVRENPVTLNDGNCATPLPFICELQPVKT